MAGRQKPHHWQTLLIMDIRFDNVGAHVGAPLRGHPNRFVKISHPTQTFYSNTKIGCSHSNKPSQSHTFTVTGTKVRSLQGEKTVSEANTHPFIRICFIFAYVKTTHI